MYRIIVHRTYSLSRSRRKSSAVHSKSSMNWGRGFLNQFMRKPLQSLSGKRDSKCNASILWNLSANCKHPVYLAHPCSFIQVFKNGSRVLRPFQLISFHDPNACVARQSNGCRWLSEDSELRLSSTTNARRIELPISGSFQATARPIRFLNKTSTYKWAYRRRVSQLDD